MATLAPFPPSIGQFNIPQAVKYPLELANSITAHPNA